MIAELFLTCVLALRPSISIQADTYTQADRAFFQMMRAMSPSGEFRIVEYGKHQRSVMELSPGGFLLIRGPYGAIREYFRNREWEMLPFYWRDHQIWRKPVRGLGSST